MKMFPGKCALPWYESSSDLAADSQPILFLECDGREGSIRVVVSRQQPVRFGVRHDDRLAAEALCPTNVVGVGVTSRGH